MSQRKVLVVDDHAIFRTGLALVVRTAIPAAVVAEVASLQQALELEGEAPDVVLLDIQLAGLNGLECIAPFKRRWPAAAVLVASSHEDPQTMRTALARGADEFVSKAEPAARIGEVIQTALARQGTEPPQRRDPRARAASRRGNAKWSICCTRA